MRITFIVALSIMVSGCNSQVLRQLGASAANVVVVQTVSKLMSPSSTGSSGGMTGSGGDLEGCDSPQAMRRYLDRLKSGNLYGGIDTAKEHCATYRSIQPLTNEQCVSIGYGYKACPAIADGRTRVWTVGRRPGVGTGLN